MKRSRLFFSLIAGLLSTMALAGPDQFSKGPLINDYGENVVIDEGLPDPAKQRFKVLFDIAESEGQGKVSRKFNSVARFINMHIRAGVPRENINVAMVIHGKAGFDVMNNAAYKERFLQDNASLGLLQDLQQAGVAVYLCGQSAVHLDIERTDLSPGVRMSLSAMTANALLQQQGYTLNPF